MSILNFRKQRQYTKNKSGQYDLVSNWTSAETVYDRDGHCVMERLDNALLPMVDGTDNGKLLTVKNGGWAKDMVIPNVDSEDDGKVFTVKNGEWAKDNIVTDKVKQTITDSDNHEYRILFSETHTHEASAAVEEARSSTKLLYNPSLESLWVTTTRYTDQTHLYGIGLQPYYGSITLNTQSSQGGLNTCQYDDNGNFIASSAVFPTDIELFGTNNKWDGTNTSLKTTITNLRPIVVKKTVTSDSNLRVHCSIDPSDIDSSWTDFTHVTLCSLSLMNKANNKTYYAMGDSNHSNPYFEYQQSSMDLSYDVLSLGGSAGQEYLFTFVFLPIDNARVISLDT